MGEIYRLKEAGELNAQQWHWTAPAKPLEELYDLQNDPDEVNNLAADPQHLGKLKELRGALNTWIAEINDPLDTPEMEVLRTRVWPPEGEQPKTATPRINVSATDDAAAPHRVTITCETEGASVGYRLSEAGPWLIYSGPFNTNAEHVEVQAQRIGWKPARAQQTLD